MSYLPERALVKRPFKLGLVENHDCVIVSIDCFHAYLHLLIFVIQYQE